jgi:hypothetical protein
VQVDPITSTLKVPETKCLKLKYDELLSSFGFKFNLRRFNEAVASCKTAFGKWRNTPLGKAVQLQPMIFMVKLLGTRRLKLKYAIMLSSCAFNFKLRRYRWARAPVSCSSTR